MTGAGSSGRRKLLVRLMVGGAVLVLLCIVAVAMLPTILSTASFRNSLVSEANRALGGTVELSDLSLSLFGRQRIEGLALWPGAAGDGEPLLQVPRAEFDKDVLPILMGRLSFRGRVDGFRARLVVHEDGSTNLGDFLGRRAGGRRVDRRIELGAGPGGPWHEAPGRPPRRTVRDARELWPPTACDVVLEDGSALWVDERAGTTRGVEALRIALTSARYDDPITLEVDARVRVDEASAPFRASLRTFGGLGSRWELSVRAEGLPPGRLLAPLLAAAWPLLAGDGGAGALSVEAPLDLDLTLAGEDVVELLDRTEDETAAGRITLRLGAGRVQGAVLARAQAALDALAARGVLPPAPDGAPRLALRGLVAELDVRDGRVVPTRVRLVGADGALHEVAVEGEADLHGTLRHRIPWSALVPDAPALAGRALTIEGRWDAPEVDDGLTDLLALAAPGDAAPDAPPPAGDGGR